MCSIPGLQTPWGNDGKVPGHGLFVKNEISSELKLTVKLNNNDDSIDTRCVHLASSTLSILRRICTIRDILQQIDRFTLTGMFLTFQKWISQNAILFHNRLSEAFKHTTVVGKPKKTILRQYSSTFDKEICWLTCRLHNLYMQ